MTPVAMLAVTALFSAAAYVLAGPPPLGRLGSRPVPWPRNPAVWRGGAFIRRRTPARRTRLAVAEACAATAAALRAGCPPHVALQRAARDVPALAPVLEPAVTAARLGGDVPTALQRAASAPGAAGLRRLAVSWQVAADTGAAPAQLVDRVAQGLRAQEAHRHEVSAQLAGPRASARLLAVLPAFGLVLGALMGARPLDVLLGTPGGWACLAGGLALDLLGLWWVESLARRAEATP